MNTSMILEATSIESIDPMLVDGFAAMADPTRLAILRVLSDGPRCVCDLNEAVPVATNVLSYHLKVLRDAGLVSATRRGRWVDYQVIPAALRRLRAAVPSGPAPATAEGSQEGR